MSRRTQIQKAASPPTLPPATRVSRQALFSELGVTGITQYGGRLNEEIIRELSGGERYKKLKEFRENNETVGSIFFAFTHFVRKVAWEIIPYDAAVQADLDIAQFVSEVLFDDMDDSWPQHIVSAVDAYLSYGFAYHEIVWKQRGGNVDDITRRSKFDDGRTGIRRLALRPAETMIEWRLTDTGDVIAFVQSADIGERIRVILAEKAVHYRFRGQKNSPEGRPLLRNAYPSWTFLQGVRQSEAIGISRNLEGIAVAWVPSEMIQDISRRSELEAFRKLVTNIGANEQQGVVYPLEYDLNGNKKYDLTILTTGGAANSIAATADTAIRRYQHDIALSVLAQWIFFGLEKVGTQALSSNITEIFGYAVEAVLDEPTAVVNAHLIPKILALNGLSLDRQPKLAHGRVFQPDLLELGQVLQQLAGVGYDVVGEAPDVLGWVANQMGFPRKEQQDMAEE